VRTKREKYVIGIDEAGRGPLAGPVAIGAVAIVSRSNLDIQLSRFDLSLGRLRNSKKLSPKKREQWYAWLKQQQKNRKFKFAVALVSAKIIDRIGIVQSINLAIKRCLKRLNLKPNQCHILLDGSLRAPQIYKNQKTIIRGDEIKPIIALASIIAKVTRDRKMIRLAKKFPNYNFEQHKGYGTKAHYRALNKHGLLPLHRRSFLKNF